jgi:hypothetical protein
MIRVYKQAKLNKIYRERDWGRKLKFKAWNQVEKVAEHIKYRKKSIICFQIANKRENMNKTQNARFDVG